jgi:hypothetical protein
VSTRYHAALVMLGEEKEQDEAALVPGNHKGKEEFMPTLVAGGEWFVILPILCCGLPLLLLFFFGRRRGGGPKD